MKKVTLLFAVLFISVLCSACINNVAIQELNNKAREYMQKGDIESAVSRLESSVDLDGTVFETRYNLGIAYISAQEFKKAQTQLEEAIKIKPDFADSYYSLAIAQESDGFSVIEDDDSPDSEVEVEVVSDDVNDELSDVKNIPKEDASHLVKMLNLAIESYNKYLELKPETQDIDEVKAQIENLEDTSYKYAKKYNLLAPADGQQ